MVKRVMKRVTHIKEQELWVDGEFLAEEDMVELKMAPPLGFSSSCDCMFFSYCVNSTTDGGVQLHLRQRISAIKAECALHKGWIRQLGFK